MRRRWVLRLASAASRSPALIALDDPSRAARRPRTASRRMRASDGGNDPCAALHPRCRPRCRAGRRSRRYGGETARPTRRTGPRRRRPPGSAARRSRRVRASTSAARSGDRSARRNSPNSRLSRRNCERFRSATRKGAITVPRCGKMSTSCSLPSRASASRTGVRLTPSCSARPPSEISSKGLRSKVRMRSQQHGEDALGRGDTAAARVDQAIGRDTIMGGCRVSSSASVRPASCRDAQARHEMAAQQERNSRTVGREARERPVSAMLGPTDA